MHAPFSFLIATASLVSVAAGCAHAPAPASEAAESADPGAAPGDTGAADVPFEVPRFERTDVGTTGLSAYLPKGFPAFNVTDSPDGSRVHSGEIGVGGFAFGCIALRFKDPLAPDEDPEALLASYLDFLKAEFNITSAAGYGRGHTLESEPAARGIIDYWVDKNGEHYALEGWVTPTHLAVLYVVGPKDYPNINVQQLYLGGIRFAPTAPAAPVVPPAP